VYRTKLLTKNGDCKSFSTLFQRDYVHIVGISISFNCKRKSVFIDVYFYTIPERM